MTKNHTINIEDIKFYPAEGWKKAIRVETDDPEVFMEVVGGNPGEGDFFILFYKGRKFCYIARWLPTGWEYGKDFSHVKTLDWYIDFWTNKKQKLASEYRDDEGYVVGENAFDMSEEDLELFQTLVKSAMSIYIPIECKRGNYSIANVFDSASSPADKYR